MYASFLLGVLCAFAGVGWGLASRRRAQCVGRFLLRAAGPDVVTMRPSQVPIAAVNSNLSDLVSGLRGLGASISEARSAAGLAVNQLPAGSFEDQFKAAVRLLRKSA